MTTAKKKEEKKEENNIEKMIANTIVTLDLLKAEYNEKPSNPLSTIMVAQELILKELKTVLEAQSKYKQIQRISLNERINMDEPLYSFNMLPYYLSQVKVRERRITVSFKDKICYF